jgi:hypothetical protein
MRTVLYMRKDSNYTPFTGCPRGFSRRHKTWLFPAKIEAWNNLFNMTYRETRKAIADIASDNYHRLGADIILNYNDPWSYDLLQTVGDGWVLPMDDDDWLPDNILTEIRSKPVADMYWWNSIHLMCSGSDQDIVARGNPHSVMLRNPIDGNPDHGGMCLRLRKLHRSRQRLMAANCCYVVPIRGASKGLLDKHHNTKGIRGVAHNSISCYIGHPVSVTTLCDSTPDEKSMMQHVERMRHFDESLLPRPEFKSKLRKLTALFNEIRPKKIIVNGG